MHGSEIALPQNAISSDQHAAGAADQRNTEEVLRGTRRTLRVVDPAMADGGKLYKGFTLDFVEEMKSLCSEADVIVPNLTEGCLLTGTEYREDGDEEYWKELLVQLAALGSRSVVLTGFSAGGEIGAIAYSVEDGTFRSYVNEKLPVQFHGTGDIFASVLAGALTLGRSLDDAVQLAVDFTLESMRATQADPERVFYGVNFEAAIPGLVAALSSQPCAGKTGDLTERFPLID